MPLNSFPTSLESDLSLHLSESQLTFFSIIQKKYWVESRNTFPLDVGRKEGVTLFYKLPPTGKPVEIIEDVFPA